MAEESQTPPIVAVVGATASGKSHLALDLAELVGGEIINSDAMAVYRGMDIGTAKTPPHERRGVPHHLLDHLDVTEPLSVGDFQHKARTCIAEVRARGAVPIMVGGSALYTRAVLDQFEFPGTDPEVRARWEAELAAVGPEALHQRLAEQDPEAAAKIRPENGRRIVRALEVIELTAGPFTASLPGADYFDARTLQIGVHIDRATLHARIEQRVRDMYAAGLVAEVEVLLAQGLADSRTASAAIGYREAAAVIAGQWSEAEAIERTVIATRQFARRQEAWFRKDPRIHWVSWNDPDRAERAREWVEGAR